MRWGDCFKIFNYRLHTYSKLSIIKKIFIILDIINLKSLTITKYNITFLAFFLLSKISAQKIDLKEKKTNYLEPKIVVPGNFSSPPSDAIVLFDGSNFSPITPVEDEKTSFSSQL